MLQTHVLNSEIFIADDEEWVRDSLSSQFTLAGYQVTTFEEGTSLIRAARARIPACILLDICMPGPSGLDILKELDAANYSAPIFIVSGRGDIPSAVLAIKNGAFDFIEKQTEASSIVERVDKAIAAWTSCQQQGQTSEILWRHFPGRDQLTRREIEVLAHIAAAASNKEAARDLGISRRTIEVHRKHIMQKLGAKNAVDLVRIVLKMQHGAQTPLGSGSASVRNNGRAIQVEMQRG
jgi:two-component system, LuxR family, response regulator FixJ